MANKEMVEKKVNRGFFKVKIGSTNRNDQKVIYFEGTTYIAPMFSSDDYSAIISEFEKYAKSEIKDVIDKVGIFDKDYISIFDIATERMEQDKYSCLQFEYYLKQIDSEKRLTVKELAQKSSETYCLKPFENLSDKIFNSGFLILNEKSKPAV